MTSPIGTGRSIIGSHSHATHWIDGVSDATERTQFLTNHHMERTRNINKKSNEVMKFHLGDPPSHGSRKVKKSDVGIGKPDGETCTGRRISDLYRSTVGSDDFVDDGEAQSTPTTRASS